METPRPPNGPHSLPPIILLVVFVGGCSIFARRPEPVPPPVPRSEVLSALHQRAEQFRTVYDTGISLVIEVQTNEGMKPQPTLGGVLAFDSRLPGLWLHTEKMTKKIFSLHATADRFSLELPDTCEMLIGGQQAYERLPHLIHPYEAMAWFGSPEWLGLNDRATMAVEENDYRFDVSLSGLPVRSVFVDRRRVAISRIVDYSLLGDVRTDVLMNDYKKVKGIEFPHRLTVNRPQHGCRVQLKLGSPKFNKDLKAEVFQPKKLRPGWRQIDLDHEPLSSVKAFGAEE